MVCGMTVRFGSVEVMRKLRAIAPLGSGGGRAAKSLRTQILRPRLPIGAERHRVKRRPSSWYFVGPPCHLRLVPTVPCPTSLVWVYRQQRRERSHFREAPECPQDYVGVEASSNCWGISLDTPRCS